MTKKKYTQTEENEFDNATIAAEMAENLANEDVKNSLSEEECTEEAIELTSEELLEKKLILLENKIEELNDNALRARAEFENYRKRTVRDIATARFHTQLNVITPFLTVFEHFKMAMMAADSSENIDALVQGMKMISKEFSKALDDLDVKCFDAVGDKFNPLLHEAVGHEHSDKIEEGFITKQWSAGYKLGDKLLRPAMVVVSSGVATEEEINENKK